MAKKKDNPWEPESGPVPTIAPIKEPVKLGFIRYRVPGNETSFSNSVGTWLVKDGHVDLPKDHTFWVYVGCILFEE